MQRRSSGDRRDGTQMIIIWVALKSSYSQSVEEGSQNCLIMCINEQGENVTAVSFSVRAKWLTSKIQSWFESTLPRSKNPKMLTIFFRCTIWSWAALSSLNPPNSHCGVFCTWLWPGLWVIEYEEDLQRTQIQRNTIAAIEIHNVY